MKIRRVDLHADEFLSAITGEMTPAELGVYWMVCLLVYARGGAIHDDPDWLRAKFKPGKGSRVISGIVDRLVATGRVDRVGTEISVRRCREEIENATRRVREAAESGRRGGRPKGKQAETGTRGGRDEAETGTRGGREGDESGTRQHGADNQINDIAKGDALHSEKLTTNYQLPTTKEETPNGVLSGNGQGRYPDVAVEMTKIWNEECGSISKARKPTGNRVGRCARAWRDEFGGVAGQWREFCRRVAGSTHLRGENDRGWHADLDWVLKPENLAHIMEGRYDRAISSLPGSNGYAGPDAPAPSVEELFGDEHGGKMGLAH